MSPINKRITQLKFQDKKITEQEIPEKSERKRFTRSVRQKSVNERPHARLADFLTSKESVLDAINSFKKRESRKKQEDETLPHLS